MITGQRTATVRLARSLYEHVPPSRRRSTLTVALDGTSSLLHVVESLGPPRTEIGAFRAAGRAVPGDYRLRDGDAVEVLPVARPQRLPSERFLLDGHLGTLARRMRLLGLDTAYSNDAEDAALVRWAASERRVLLTRDRGLLRRRALPLGAYVRGDHPEEQLADVLDRFEPRLEPWTRCSGCNGRLLPISAAAAAPLVEPGTRHSYERFAQCAQCARVYWRGAHADRLEQVVEHALAARR